MSEKKAKKVVHLATAEEVHDVLADSRDDDDTVARFGPQALDFYSLVAKILGADPLRGKNCDPNFGGRSKDAWVNEVLSVSHLRKLLAQMIEQGVIVKVTDPTGYTFTAEEKRIRRSIRFPYRIRAGYLLTETYEAAMNNGDVKTRNERRTKLMAEAKDALAKLHADELNRIYVKMCTGVDLDPEQEETADA